MDLDKIIEYFGGTPKTCDALDVTKGAISQWRTEGIPKLRQFQIETLTAGKFKADRSKAEAA